DELRSAYETMARFMGPSEVIGVAMNGARLTADEALQERERVSEMLGLPVGDVIRDGPERLLEPIERLLAARLREESLLTDRLASVSTS
ncbi:MAG: DUF1611 domain-containing protein, partial [Planctomycetota bacterium]